jgi:hypothetical protein
VVRNHENIIGNDNQLIIPNEQKSMNKNNRIKMMAMDDDTWDAFINS